MKKIVFLILLSIIVACKTEKTKEQALEIKEVIESETTIVEEKPSAKEIQKSCLGNNTSLLDLPIVGGESLMITLMEEDIEGQQLECDFEKLKSKLCSLDVVSYYYLSHLNGLNLIIVADECGDNTNYLLAILKEEKITDVKVIYSSWIEMSENSKKVITNFTISKDLKIGISKKVSVNGKILMENNVDYIIAEEGIFVKI